MQCDDSKILKIKKKKKNQNENKSISSEQTPTAIMNQTLTSCSITRESSQTGAGEAADAVGADATVLARVLLIPAVVVFGA